MPMMMEHLDAGFKGAVVHLLVVLGMYETGIVVDSWQTLVGFLGFGSAALVVGSDLPDIDARSAPIHKLFAVLVPGSVLLVLLGPMGIPLQWASVAAGLSFLAFLRLMPPHRRFIHTARAGLIMGAILAVLLVVVVQVNAKVSLWTGFWLFLGHMVHLWKDRWIRI